MDEFCKNYDNVIFLGDCNTCINDNVITCFCSLNDLTSLIDQPICFDMNCFDRHSKLGLRKTSEML